ncbi:MAG: biopolymer transporter ExbD [Pseudomonadota bacterium]
MRLRNRGFGGRALSLTPLIDIIFLLLLFFMLTSTFTRFGEVPLVQAAGGAAAADSDRQRLFLRLTEDTMTVNGRPVVGPVAASLTDAMGGEDALGLLTYDREVTSQRLVSMLAELRGVTGLSVAVLQ